MAEDIQCISVNIRYNDQCIVNINKGKKTTNQTEDIQEGDTPLPPGVLRTALFWPCVLRTAIFSASRTAYRLTTKTTIFLAFPFT